MAGYHVRQRGKSGRWYAVIDLGTGPDGKRKQKWVALSPAITGKREAEAAARKLAVQRDQGKLAADDRMTVAQLVELWLAETEPKRAETTAYQYRNRLEKHIAPMIGSVRIGDVRPHMIERFYQELIQGGPGRAPLKPQTVGIIHSMLRSAFQMAVRRELVPHNPVAAIPKPSGDPKEKVVLEPDQFRQLLNCLAGTRMAMPVMMLGMTGLRRGELLALRWANVDFKNAKIRVVEQLTRAGGKLVLTVPKSKKGIREVPLPALVVDALQVYRAEQAKRRKEAGPAWVDRDLVFDNGLGDYWPPTTFSSALAAAASRAGFSNLTPHALRHGYASIVYDETEDMKLIQELLGHSTLAVTANIYTHIFEAKKRRAAEAIERVFGDDRKPA
uniref:tyrosine-type recombinase/integrase n=1 Tax=Symbiobacterium terraclitae TaxID=557451 RepID=UPI0035B52AC3